MTDIDPHHVKAGTIREVMLSHASAAPAKRGADPGDIARAIVGKDEKKWRQLMKPIKDEAVRMAKDGKLVLLRKGKPYDPDRLRGLYRIRLLAEGEAMPVFAATATDLDLLDDEDDDF